MFVDASAYERFMGRWSARLAPLFVDAALGVDGPPPAAVLDVGCGTGNLTAELVGRWPTTEVVGVDPSPPFVEGARRRFSDSRFRGEVGSATDLPVDDGAVDAALALLVLNFVPDPPAGVAEMRRVLRPGGVAAAAVWDYGGGMAMLRTFWDAAAEVHGGTGVVDQALDRPAQEGGLEAMFEEAGLGEVVGGVLEVPMHFESFADYWDPFLLGIGPAGDHVLGLDDEGREALRAELERRLGSGAVEMTSTARWVRGVATG